MNSLGVFFDLNLKKSNDLMEVFDEALSKTNNLMETMDNFNTHKKIEKINNNIESNKNDINNYNIIRKNNKLKTYNPQKANKAKLRPIKNNNQYYFRKREPYNYQKEYENELINQIEKLFNPSYQNNGKKEEVGMLSFLSPLINSNIDEKNKKFYRNKKELNKSKNSKISELNTNTINKNNEKENDLSSNESENFLGRGLNRKYSNNSNNSQKLKISRKNTFARKGNNYYNFEGQKFRGYNSIGKKFRNNEEFQKNKYDIPEISELKKNRYFSRTKSNFRNAIVARDVSGKSRKNESNVDQLINKLKKHYS
jgi:hypothetical protein